MRVVVGLTSASYVVTGVLVWLAWSNFNLGLAYWCVFLLPVTLALAVMGSVTIGMMMLMSRMMRER